MKLLWKRYAEYGRIKHKETDQPIHDFLEFVEKQPQEN